jgi:hypothetical protein
MEDLKKFSFRAVLTILVVLFFGVSAVAGETTDEQVINPIADITIGANGIGWTPKVNYARMKLTVSGPDGTVISKSFDAGVTPYLGLSDNKGNYFIDGSYTYELRVIPTLEKKVRTAGDSGAGIPREKPLVQSGSFTILGGGFVSPTTGPEPGLAKPLDQVILDDLIVDGSLCVGFDCINGESFGFDTIRLKENNIRIKFQDTSNTASFPSNDWQITANDSSNGGLNKFSIDDISGGRTPFTIEASAPSHSIYVDDGGRVGFGTSTPVADLHVESGNTPTLRLEQDGSSGFTAQTWDVSGNEANFFIRDATNGSTLPIRIRPGAPTSSIDIDSNGRIGIGTDSPDYAVHLLTGSGTGAQIIAEKTGGATMEFSASGSYGIAGTKSTHPLRLRVNDQYIMELDGTQATPLLNMGDGLGNYNAGWNYSSSRELKTSIKDLTVSEVMDALDHLTPVKFRYKIREDEQRVGFIAEDVPDLVANGDRKSLNPMDILAVLTKVVKEQQKTISELQEKIKKLENK